MTITSTTSIEQKLTRSRIQLLLNHPFFGTLCLRLRLIAMPALPWAMATDGRKIAYNPDRVSKLTPAEIEGVLAHEVLHNALGHHCRRGNRDPKLWNRAADYAINPLLINSGLKLPEGALQDSAFTDLSAEEIYARLAQQSEGSGGQQAQQGSGGSAGSQPGQAQAPQQNSNPSAGAGAPGAANGSGGAQTATGGPQAQEGYSAAEGYPGDFGEVMDAVGEDGAPASPAELQRQLHEWAISSEQALRSATACGRLPGGLERPLREVRESRCDWRSILRDFISATDPSDYRWTPPNRRFVSSGLFLPSVTRSGVGEIVIAVDTSGSIGPDELEQFAGEITAISEEAKPERIHVVYCDAAVQATEEFEAGEQVKLSAKGGGGTDFVPPFRWVEENGLAPKCLMYLTDLCCNSYPEIPEYPVLWVTDSRRTAPFGETVRIGPTDPQ